MTDQPTLDRFQEWHDQYRASLVPSPLEDISQLAAQLDLTHAHPSGIAQLFASGHVTLDSLFRDNGMLRAAERRLGRVLDDRGAKKRVSGVAGLSLVVGVATWKGNALPVLLYPVEAVLSETPGKSSITFTGTVTLNDSFVSVMHAAGVDLDEQYLFDGSHYATGTPETSAVFGAITKQVNGAIGGFAIERHIILGCFKEPAAQILAETQRIIDDLGNGPSGNPLLDALAGDEKAAAALHDAPIADYSPFDADPHTEYEVGDVDNTVRYAAQLAASGHSITVDGALGRDTAEQAAAIASRCVMNGRSVLYVPGVAEQKRRFTHVMRANEMQGLLLDIADDKANASIDRQLITAVGFQEGVATQHFEQLADELVGVRSRLTRYLGDLHGVSEKWGVSAYQTIQNLAAISVAPTHPATRVRLTEHTARQVGGRIDEWAGKLERAGELGEYTIGPNDTAWYKASLTSEKDAVNAYQRVVDLLEKVLPAVRDQVASTVQACGFPVPSTAREWSRQIIVLKNLRRVLDVFQPEIFERDIDAMIEASKSKADRKAEGTTMGFWERRRHVREAKSLLRVGAQVEDLHAALIVVRKQAEQWRTLVPHGGWPVLPPKLDQMIAAQETMSSDMTALDAVLSTTPRGGELETRDLNEVEARLKELFDDHKALDTLPERCRLENEFQAVGLTDLVTDLTNRRVGVHAVGAELQLAWWTTVFEDIVRSSPIISNQDGSVLANATERFEQVDVEHVRSVGPMVAQESIRRLSDMLFARTQEANLLHTQLAGRTHASIDRVRRDHPEILAAAKPILMATPDTLASLTEPRQLADVAIIDACAHIPAVQLLSVLVRVRQVVVVAHCGTVTCDSLKRLIGMLPAVQVKSHPVRRSPLVTAFLESQGYGAVRYDVTTDAARGGVAYHKVEANGTPVFSTGLVESSQQEIDEVVRLIIERAKSFPIVPTGYLLTVVTLTDVFRVRLGAELKSLAAKDKAMNAFLRHVRLVGIREVAGAQATDVILSLCYAKTVHGRLLQQFGALEDAGGRGMLLDALALADRHLDIVSAFSSTEMEDERIHQAGPKLLKSMLVWAEQLTDEVAHPAEHRSGYNTLFNDLAERIRSRGLDVSINYGFDNGLTIPMVVGLHGKPYALAVLTDDAGYMSIQSTRERHRMLSSDLMMLGWSVITVWSVGAFVNPEKEVDRIVAQIGEIYREVK
ncbi:helicase [Bifidobacterium sp. CP2]|uniref:helicase n=1 Tax=Bifidobacterium TaxID=1678 RepID=UPI001BDBDDC7|nr:MULTISPECIES: helicase [Bifidobacterium]MBT1181484.1 helicase [Bifidobacterium sp. CP2]MBW3081003.1 helicase [Bifidobacterium saguinibicoloris]